MVLIVVSVLLSTTNCSTWRDDSSGNRSCEVGDDEFNELETYLWLFFA